MVLRTGSLQVAVKLQEASDMMHSDVRNHLIDAVRDAHKGTGSYASYVDHNGDGSSGDCIYSCDDKMHSAPYEIQTQGGKTVANVDTANAERVSPVVSYAPLADDDDNYASMMEAGLYSKGPIPLCERFISKGERDKMDSGSFAGKGKSFPINKPGDVMAAVRSMGRAGSANYGVAQLKANIIRIAKAKGWTSELPKTWRGDSTDSSEAATTSGSSAALNLVESAATLETIVLKESKSDYEIKLIAPGKGSSAFYPAEVLKRDGPKVFQAGTHVYLNHPTAAEESARPEGDLRNLAGVLSTGATYNESHAKGPGLYARMKVFADHAQTVEEKAPHVGMSIRASGVAEANRKQDGLPVLKELTHAESVDVVTRAGAGGMILTEAAKPGNSQEVEMTEQQINALVESAVNKAVAAVTSPVKALEQRALKGDAMVEASRILNPLALRESAKTMVVDNVLRFGELPVKDGALDTAKFGEFVMAEAKRVASAIGYDGVQGMGSGAPPIFGEEPMSEKKRLKEAKRRAALQKMEHEDSVSIFESLGMPKDAAEFAAKGRAA